MTQRRIPPAFGALALAAALVIPFAPQSASAAVTGTVGRLNLATSKAEIVAGLQESTIAFPALDGAAVGGKRTQKAASVKITVDKKATIGGVCNGTDVTGPGTAACVSSGLIDPNKLEGKDEIVSYDDVTGSVGGVAVIPASVASSAGLEIATAPQTRPFARGGALGPGGITTTDRTGVVKHMQWVNGVVAGPNSGAGPSCGASATPPTPGPIPGDGSAANYNGSTCTTPLAAFAETTAPFANSVTLDTLMVGIGDLDLSPDGTSIIATNLHDGFLYSGAIDADGPLTKIATRPAFATTPDWRPYGLASYGDSLIVTWTQIGVSSSASFAVASYNPATNKWAEMMAPVAAADLGDAGSYGVMTAAEIDAKGKLNVTFIPVWRQGTEPFGRGVSAPALQLASNGLNHWANNVGTAAKLTSYSIDNSTDPSFGRTANDQVTGRVALTTIDALHFHSGGFTEYNTDGTNAGREQLTWRGIGDGGYKVGTDGTVNDGLASTDTDLLVYDSGSATPWVDAYAFGKMSGLGDIENIANQATIGNRAWADSNGNGIQDTGEPSIAGVALEVLDAAGNAIIDPATGVAAVVVTDADGNWILTVDSDVKVQVRVAAINWTAGPFATGATYDGWNITKIKQGADASLDSNADATSRTLLATGGQAFRAGTTDFSFDVGFAKVVAPPIPCIKLLTEVQDRTGAWLDANTAAAAAVVAADRTAVVYRFTATNCGKEDLSGVTISTGIPGNPTLTVGALAIGASSVSADVAAAKTQLITAATVTGKGVVSGTTVDAADPAQAITPPVAPPVVVGTKLPATGRNAGSIAALALGLLLVGFVAVRIARVGRPAPRR
jgi:hypothetical protein